MHYLNNTHGINQMTHLLYYHMFVVGITVSTILIITIEGSTIITIKVSHACVL